MIKQLTNHKLCPYSAMPGFMNHQTDRHCSTDRTVACNVRDYDFYGAPYSVLSAIGTGGLNAVVCGIPARDPGEYAAFPSSAPDPRTASAHFYSSWLDWVSARAELFRGLRPLPAPPGPGTIDGTYATDPAALQGVLFLFNPDAQAAATPPGLLGADSRLGLGACTPGQHVFAVGEVWPVPSSGLALVPCGANFSLVLEGRSATVLNISLAPAAAAEEEKGEEGLLLFGRALRAHSSSSLALHRSSTGSGSSSSASQLQLLLSGSLEDSTHLPTSGCAVAPLYALLPTPLLPQLLAGGSAVLRAASSAVPAAATASAASWQWSLAAADTGMAGRDSSSAAHCPPRSLAVGGGAAAAPPHLPGHTLLALRPTAGHLAAAAAASPTFTHSQAVSGMSYNDTRGFAGGLLSGTVSVPASVLAQLAARAQLYPVPWAAEDAAVPWLAPARLLVFLDAPTLPPTAAITATLSGAPLPVQLAYNCRSQRAPACFTGWWLDLTAAGVAEGGVDYALQLSLPEGMGLGAFAGAYYDNVDTVFTAV